MTLEERLNRLDSKVQAIEDREDKKLNTKLDTINQLEDKVRAYTDRVKDACAMFSSLNDKMNQFAREGKRLKFVCGHYDNGKPKTKYFYENHDFTFEAEGIQHRLGVYLEYHGPHNFTIKGVGKKGGGCCDFDRFYLSTEGYIVYDYCMRMTEDTKIRLLNEFLKDYDEWEKSFYNAIDNITL